MHGEPQFLERDDGARIAYHFTPGKRPTVVFLGGFTSDMTGRKATCLEAFCRDRGQAFLRFDYRGHGASSGALIDGSVGAWAEDARTVLEALTAGALVLVGSSMGGWIMLLVARHLGRRVVGLVGVAAAPDFTEELMWAHFSSEQRSLLRGGGVLHLPSEYDDGSTPVTMRLIEDGRTHLLLGGTLDVRCPVRLLHGLDDPDVPWRTALRLTEVLASDDVRLVLVKGGGHRLSEPRDLALLTDAVAELCR